MYLMHLKGRLQSFTGRGKQRAKQQECSILAFGMFFQRRTIYLFLGSLCWLNKGRASNGGEGGGCNKHITACDINHTGNSLACSVMYWQKSVAQNTLCH